MRAFEVFLNGERLCLAGIGDDGVLNAMVDCVAKPPQQGVELSVGGLISPPREHVDWVDRKVSVGDQILVKIVDAGRVDEPSKRHSHDPATELTAQKNYVRRMAREFGWEVRVPLRQREKQRRRK
jgi:hypothetical protein